MPFITEEIFTKIQSSEESIMISRWPVASDALAFEKEEKEIELMKDAVRGIRNARSGMNVPPSRKTTVFVVSEKEEVRGIFERGKLFFAPLAFASELKVQQGREGIGEDAVSVVIHDAIVYLPLAELVDLAAEKERLAKEEKKLLAEIARAEGMLKNERFLSKAPEAKVQEEKDKLEKYTQMLQQIKLQLAQMG
jgi:valyl-tRNA synthetase